ncbi:hypothetical protein HZH68_010645 [Vespula germanica]|uniref:Uncharacterized protein n=1 Tax=Vespula germanica TaxID=30212 RepID=A0A834JY91_VESGE|nr:hypothetical protein HZH68_010645 [Vespula germanica]
MISARASQRRIDPREAASVDRHPVSEVVDPSLGDRPLFSQESKAVTMGICAQYIQGKGLPREQQVITPTIEYGIRLSTRIANFLSAFLHYVLTHLFVKKSFYKRSEIVLVVSVAPWIGASGA